MFDRLVGQTLNHYNIIRKIGDDRLGALFLARDTSFQRDVGILVLQPSLASQPGFAEQFNQAARMAVRLDHPNLVEVIDVGESQGFKYLVTEFISGDTLEDMLANLRRSRRWMFLSEAVSLVRQLALVLEYIRSQGAPPRSAAPAYIKIKAVQSDRLPYLPVLTDLGLNSLLDGMTGSRLAVAPAYVSPEECIGRSPDARSDVYGLGVLLFELATGQLPFPIRTPDDAVQYHTRQPVPPPRSIRPDLPESLERIIVTALQKNPEARFASPAVFAAQLESVAPQVDPISSPPPAFDQAVGLIVPYRQSLNEAPTEAFEPVRPLAAATTQASPGGRTTWQKPVDVILENVQLSVEPGSTISSRVTLRNRGMNEGFFRVTAEGLPAGWISITPEVVQLAPGEQRDVTLTVQPPRTPQSRAGRYPLIVRAVNQQAPAEMGEARGTITVTTFSRFSSRLITQTLRTGETGQVSISNLGNTPDTFTLSFQDPEGELEFAQAQEHLRIAEGQTAVAEFRAGLRRQRWIGSERSHPFSVAVTSTTGETQTHKGEVISQAVVPAWLLGILVILFLCVAGSFALFLARSGLQVNGATATVIAEQTGTAVAFLSTSQAETATALYLADANQATITAVTATAAWLAADTDEDGLTNQRELELTTLPDNPDTDGDKLGDGDEVNRNTDPLKPDTDGDSLTDGDEVARNLDPLKPDTDGDGIPDAQDPSPLLTSTPAPDTQATAAAATAQAAAQTATAQQIIQGTQAAGTASAATSAAATSGAVGAATAAAATNAAAASTAAAATAIAQAQTATAQAAAAQTATANAGGAATSAAATSLANAATQTATAGTRVVYVFSTDINTARDYQALLQGDGNGFLVDLVTQDTVLSTNFDPYRAILVGPETGREDRWGDQDGNQLNHLIDTGLPILGLGEGGFTFFALSNIGTGWADGVTSETTGVAVVDPNSPVWSNPNQLNVQANQSIALYTANTPTAALTADAPSVDLTLIGRLPDQPNQYSIVRQNTLYLLWGYNGGPAVMTPTGKQLFENVLRFLIPPR